MKMYLKPSNMDSHAMCNCCGAYALKSRVTKGDVCGNGYVGEFIDSVPRNETQKCLPCGNWEKDVDSYVCRKDTCAWCSLFDPSCIYHKEVSGKPGFRDPLERLPAGHADKFRKARQTGEGRGRARRAVPDDAASEQEGAHPFFRNKGEDWPVVLVLHEALSGADHRQCLEELGKLRFLQGVRPPCDRAEAVQGRNRCSSATAIKTWIGATGRQKEIGE
jgi:hypothetical protein